MKIEAVEKDESPSRILYRFAIQYFSHCSPRQMIAYVSQRFYQIATMLLRQLVRIMHHTNVRAYVIAANQSGHHFPVASEIDARIATNPPDHGTCHGWHIGTGGTYFGQIQLRIGMYEQCIGQRLTDELGIDGTQYVG